MRAALGAIAGVAAGTLVAGCATPQLDRDTRRATVALTEAYERLPPQGGVVLEISSIPPPTASSQQPSKAMLKDLSDGAQSAIVRKALGGKSGLDAVRQIASTPLSPAGTPSVNYAGPEPSLDRIIVVDLAKGFGLAAADRISRAWIEIVPVNFAFGGYSAAATKFEAVTVGTIQDSATFQASAGLTPTLSTQPETTGVLGLQFGRSRTATAPVEQRVTDLNVGVTPKMLRIRREGLLNRDVGGNVFVSVTLKPDRSHAEGLSQQGFVVDAARLLTAAGRPRKAADADLTLSLASYPTSCALRARVSLIYELRLAGARGRTYVEGDDDAEYVRDVKNSTVDLVPASDVRPDLWRIGPNLQGDDRVVEAITPAGYRQPLLFDTYDKAQLFARWMSNVEARTVGRGLRLELSGTAMPRIYPAMAAGPLPRRCPDVPPIAPQEGHRSPAG